MTSAASGSDAITFDKRAQNALKLASSLYAGTTIDSKGLREASVGVSFTSQCNEGSPPAMSEDLGGVIGKPRALPALQRHMARMRPAFKAIHDICNAGTAFGEIRRVDLRDVAEAYHFRPRARARDERFHLLGRQVLRFVDDQELVDEGAPAHEVQ